MKVIALGRLLKAELLLVISRSSKAYVRSFHWWVCINCNKQTSWDFPRQSKRNALSIRHYQAVAQGRYFCRDVQAELRTVLIFRSSGTSSGTGQKFNSDTFDQINLCKTYNRYNQTLIGTNSIISTKKSGNWGLDEISCHCSHKGECTS